MDFKTIGDMLSENLGESRTRCLEIYQLFRASIGRVTGFDSSNFHYYASGAEFTLVDLENDQKYVITIRPIFKK